MEVTSAARIFEVLSAEPRLAVFRLLVKYAPGGLVAGDIAAKLDLPKTNLSFHLKALLHGGLVSMEREGRHLRYKASIPLMLKTIAFLTEECCSGDTSCCQDYRCQSGIDLTLLPPVKGPEADGLTSTSRSKAAGISKGADGSTVAGVPIGADGFTSTNGSRAADSSRATNGFSSADGPTAADGTTSASNLTNPDGS